MDGLHDRRFDGWEDDGSYDLLPTDGELPPPPPPDEGGGSGPQGGPAPRPPAPHETGLPGGVIAGAIATFVLLTASQIGVMFVGNRGGPWMAFGVALWFMALFVVPWVAGAVWLDRLRAADRLR